MINSLWPSDAMMRHRAGSTLAQVPDGTRSSPEPMLTSLTHLPLDKMAAIWADDIFNCIFLNEKVRILIKISLKFVPKGVIDNIQALV